MATALSPESVDAMSTNGHSELEKIQAFLEARTELDRHYPGCSLTCWIRRGEIRLRIEEWIDGLHKAVDLAREHAQPGVLDVEAKQWIAIVDRDDQAVRLKYYGKSGPQRICLLFGQEVSAAAIRRIVAETYLRWFDTPAAFTKLVKPKTKPN